MLPAASRLRQRPDFAAAMRVGRRAGRPRLVVHLDVPPERPAAHVAGASPRAGLVVSRTVGGAVVRNRVRRQLRHLLAARLPQLPAGARLVVRVLPPAAGSSSAELAGDLDAGLRRCLADSGARRP